MPKVAFLPILDSGGDGYSMNTVVIDVGKFVVDLTEEQYEYLKKYKGSYNGTYKFPIDEYNSQSFMIVYLEDELVPSVVISYLQKGIEEEVKERKRREKELQERKEKLKKDEEKNLAKKKEKLEKELKEIEESLKNKGVG